MALGWPDPLKPTSVGFWLDNPSRSGGVSLVGTEQRVYSPDQRWRARIEVPIRTNEQIFALRRLMARADGSAAAIDVPAFEGRRANWPVDAYGRRLDPGLTRRKSLDGTAYEDPRIPTQSQITATVAIAEAIRAVELSITVTQGAPLTHGQFVSIAGRLYILRWILSTAGTTQRFQIRPPLRAAVSVGAAVECAIPTCEMRLLTDEQVQIDLVGLQFATKTLEFVEFF